MARRIGFRRGVVPRNIVKQLHVFIEKVLEADPSKYIGSNLYYTCFNKYCIVHSGSYKYERVTQIYSGEWIGFLFNNKIYLSPWIYMGIYRDRGIRAAVKISEKGVKNFLYGRDVLEESIIEKYPPLNNPLAVIDEADDRVIGVAEPRRGFYRNIYDLGLFLRIFD